MRIKEKSSKCFPKLFSEATNAGPEFRAKIIGSDASGCLALRFSLPFKEHILYLRTN